MQFIDSHAHLNDPAFDQDRDILISQALPQAGVIQSIEIGCAPEEWKQALALAENIILADIYAARETDTLGISSQTLQTEIEKLGKKCYYFPSFDEIENFLLEKCINGDLLITMGAGDVVKIGENLIGK